jgi:copper chaperone CopZ
VAGTGHRAERASIGGAVTAAVLSSACCWLPLLLLAFGASAAGVGAFFERWRPLLAGVAIVTLGIGFYLVYFRRAKCADDACGTTVCASRAGGRGVITQVMLWIAAVLVTAFVLFPRYAGVVARAVYGDTAAVAASPADPSLVVRRYTVEGMTCEACAVTLQADLAKLDGVASAEVDYGTKSALVRTEDGALDNEVSEAARRHGYKAAPVAGDQ